jgi:hypothetical protein
LDLHRINEDGDGAEPALQDMEHIADSRAGRRSDDTDPVRQAWQRTFALHCKQPFCGQLGFQNFETPP